MPVRSEHSTLSTISEGGTRRRASITSFLGLRSSSEVDPANRHAGIDDEIGKAEFFLLLLLQSIEDSCTFVLFSIGGVTSWALGCSFFSEWLRGRAANEPGGRAEVWHDDIEACKTAVSILGTLFIFTLVFRFKACYDRWWESRIFWGDIISKSLELAMMNRRWIRDRDLADRLSRFIILFSYASKALLRGQSLAEDGSDGKQLISRGLLTKEELDHMHNFPCWQPHYCLEMIRAIIVEAHNVPNGKGLVIDDQNKIHGQLFRCFDNTVKDLNQLIGDCIRVRASGLPASYDAITMTSFFMFFTIASFVWSAAVGWMTPILAFCASSICMLLIVMGTKLVDPYGLDKVDIPMEAFCATIEAQIEAIDSFGRTSIIDVLAKKSKPHEMSSKDHSISVVRASVDIPKLR